MSPPTRPRDDDGRRFRAVGGDFPGAGRGHDRAQLFPGPQDADFRRVFRGARSGPVGDQRDRLRWRLPVGRFVPGHLRDDRVLRLRRVPVFDRLPGGLDRGAVRDRRADETLGAIHLRRRAGCPFRFAGDQAGRGDQHPGGEPVLFDPADGRRRRPDSAAVGFAALDGRGAGRRRGDRDRGHGGDGVDDLGAISQGFDVGGLQPDLVGDGLAAWVRGRGERCGRPCVEKFGTLFGRGVGQRRFAGRAAHPAGGRRLAGRRVGAVGRHRARRV